MTIYEQWDFLRVYRLDIPSNLKAKTYLDDALNKAYDLGMEADFLNMFYDMESSSDSVGPNLRFRMPSWGFSL